MSPRLPAMSLVSFFSQFLGKFCPAELNFFWSQKIQTELRQKKIIATSREFPSNDGVGSGNPPPQNCPEKTIQV